MMINPLHAACAGRAAGGESVLADQPAVPQPALRSASRTCPAPPCSDRSSTTLRPARARARTRSAAIDRDAVLESEARARSSSIWDAHDGRTRRSSAWLGEQGAGAARVRHVVRPRRAVRPDVAGVAASSSVGRPALRCAAFASEHEERVRFHCWLQWLTQIAARPRRAGASRSSRTSRSASTRTAPTPGAGRTSSPPTRRSARRRTSSTPPGRTGGCRRSCRGACAPPGTGPFIETVRATMPQGWRSADRPRHGPVPAVVGPAWGARRRAAGTCATRRRTCSTSSRSRASAPVHWWSARTSAPSSPACARRWPPAASCPTGCCGSRTTTRRSGRQCSMAAVTTHDLPTVAGVWTGSDVEEQREFGVDPAEDEWTKIRDRVGGRGGVDEDAPVDDAVEAVHDLLARAPSVLLSATLDDAAAEPERPNMPGVTDRANWCLALADPDRGADDAPLWPIGDTLRRVTAPPATRRSKPKPATSDRQARAGAPAVRRTTGAATAESGRLEDEDELEQSVVLGADRAERRVRDVVVGEHAPGCCRARRSGRCRASR